jgi:hypothetical protein
MSKRVPLARPKGSPQPQSPAQPQAPAKLSWWRIIRLKNTPATEIGRVQAADAEEAVRKAVEQYESRRPSRGG